jgi:hypothetical protein
VGGLLDLAREFVRAKLMDWIYSELGNFGQWLREYPFAIFTVCVAGALLVLGIFIVIEAFRKQGESTIIDQHERPFLATPVVTKRWAIGVAAGIAGTVGILGYGAYRFRTAASDFAMFSQIPVSLTTPKRNDVGEILLVSNFPQENNRITPVNAMLWIFMTSHQPVQAMVDSYEVDAKTQSGKWYTLIRIEAANSSAYDISQGLKNARLIEMDRLDDKLRSRQIQPRETIRGWSFFEYPRAAEREVFETIFKVRIYDMDGGVHESGEINRHGKSTLQGGELTVRPKEIDLTGAPVKYLD